MTASAKFGNSYKERYGKTVSGLSKVDLKVSMVGRLELCLWLAWSR